MNSKIHIFQQDHFTLRHFVEWLDRTIPEHEPEEWMAVYSAIEDLLWEEPELLDGHSWPELRLMAGV